MPFFPMPSKVTEDGTSPKDPIKAVLFDIFGTVVDWRGTMVKEFSSLFLQKGITDIDCEAFVESWVTAYSQNMSDISEDKKPFAIVDELNKIALDHTLDQYHITDRFSDVEKEHMWMIWHRLEPWPDSISGIDKLKKQFTIGPLSNGNIKLLEDLAKHAHLNWDVILSGERFRRYKPDPSVYQMAAEALQLKPSQILLVASHPYDLKAAQLCGYKTAYINRPLEFRTVKEKKEEDQFDFVTDSIDTLADTLQQETTARQSHSPS